MKRKLKIKPIYECRCNGRLQTKRFRPGLIPTVRPDLSQPTHWLEEEETLRSILFLRLKDFHLRLKDRLLNGSHHTLL
jgi:hypothetical protein